MPTKKTTKKAAPSKVHGERSRTIARANNTKSNGAKAFKLTYATMFNPPELMHTRYEQALAQVKANMGKDVGMLINGQERFVAEKFDDRSPINTDWLLGTFQKGGRQDAEDALAAAQAAWPRWAGMKWQDRVRLLRRAAANIEKRVYELGVVMSLEVGKNRMEGLGDAQETADLISYACDSMEMNGGFIKPMGKDPLAG